MGQGTFIIIIVLILSITYTSARKFRLGDIEFAVIAFALLACLAMVRGHSSFLSKETFAESSGFAADYSDDTPFFTDGSRKITTLLEIPGYIKNKIGEQIDGLVKDVKESSKNRSDMISKDTVTEDPDVAVDRKVDNAKYALLKREYQSIDTLLKTVKASKPDLYKRIFDDLPDTTTEAMAATTDNQGS